MAPARSRPACSSPAPPAPVALVHVFTPDWPVPPSMLAIPGYVRVTPAAEQAAHHEPERTVASLPKDVWAEAAFLHGTRRTSSPASPRSPICW